MHYVTDSFLMQCRENYFRGVTPSGPSAKPEKQALVDCFHGITAANGMAAFSGFLQEGQYYIDLWAAHLLVEHYHPEEPIWRLCMETIETYANSTINPKVAQEELEWLRRRVQA